MGQYRSSLFCGKLLDDLYNILVNSNQSDLDLVIHIHINSFQ